MIYRSRAEEAFGPLLHGWLRRSHMLRSVTPRPAGRCRITWPDLHGADRTKMAGPCGKATLSGDVVRLPERLDTQRVKSGAHDVGAGAIDALAAQAPGRLAQEPTERSFVQVAVKPSAFSRGRSNIRARQRGRPVASRAGAACCSSAWKVAKWRVAPAAHRSTMPVQGNGGGAGAGWVVEICYTDPA